MSKKVAMRIDGQRFGRLTVLYRAGSNRHNKTIWKCRCDCGTETVVEGGSLRIGNTSSCGCLKDEESGSHLPHYSGENNPRYRHGETKLPEHNAYCNMRNRCNNPHVRSYPDYGGRGIKVCERWSGVNGYKNFLSDMGRKPTPKHSLDRLDVNKDYSPENCKWATAKEQANNTRRKRIENFTNEEIQQEFIRRGLTL